MKINRAVNFITVLVLLSACRKDDDSGVITVPARLLSEVAVEDDAEIKVYLQTHFYNYEDFASPPANFDFKIVLDTIAGENANKIPMMDQVESEVITVSSSDFGRDDGEEVQHTLYYLEVREGVGESPTIGDFTILHFEGFLLTGVGFDASTNVESRIYLSGTIRGYGNGVKHLKTGTGPFENGDGTVRFEDYGIGVILFPSGLGYFDRPPPNTVIQAYSPLIFKVDVLSYEADTDFDNDGIPSIMEDLDGDGNLNNDNTDDDLEPATIFVPNHQDSDDDQDGTPTRDEIIIDNEGNITFPDSDGDGIPDYLDRDS